MLFAELATIALAYILALGGEGANSSLLKLIAYTRIIRYELGSVATEFGFSNKMRHV